MDICKTFDPHTGLIGFEPKQTLASVNISTIDDLTPEPEMTYVVKIVDVFSDGGLMEREKAVVNRKMNEMSFTGNFIMFYSRSRRKSDFS